MISLALDTSSDVVAVALHDGARVVSSRQEPGSFAHGEALAPLIERVRQEAGLVLSDLARIVVGVGPGPYTGLRVGIVTARTLAHALDIEVRGMCSLDAIAWAAYCTGEVAGPFSVAADARRHEVYLASYDGDARRVGGPQVIRPELIVPPVRAGQFVGAGAGIHADVFSDVRSTKAVDAGAIADLALARPEVLTDLTPLYLRRPDAVELHGSA